ncbi:helix-turn-helix domain-containing protein [Paenibacillus sp. GXUN7292]|uniref:response regulator n=1 Tax=Paenibacillus sp. GXUN7292 TaxID=3422499 RepID=UPI003D7CFF47
MRVLIVEDDHLVRRGLISSMPWKQFNMTVIGEAANGEEALQFLEKHKVDLLFTDLLMPIMPGLELMMHVRDMYPQVGMVVLTFYEEFQYIQEALRLGALDYIIKVDLEFDQMHAVLDRVANAMQRLKYLVKPEERKSGNKVTLISLSEEECYSVLIRLKQECAISYSELEHGVWQLFGKHDDIREKIESGQIVLPPYCGVVEWTDYSRSNEAQDDQSVMENNKLAEVYNSNTNCLKEVRGLFYYLYNKDKQYYQVVICELYQYCEQIEREQEGFFFQENNDWSSLLWTMDEDRYEANLASIIFRKPPRVALEAYFYAMMTHWKQQYEHRLLIIEMAFPWKCWRDASENLSRVRAQLRSAYSTSSYSDDVVKHIMKALDFIHLHYQKEMQISKVAAVANMSRSYFSRCFHDITGSTFNDYLRKLRIQHAKKLLEQSTRSISWIAVQSGYINEKYFSRVFRQTVGLQPREYRQQVLHKGV